MAATLSMQNFTSSLTGNLPKAILFVRDMNDAGDAITGKNLKKWEENVFDTSSALLTETLYNTATQNALKGAAQTLSSLSSLDELKTDSSTYLGFVGMEVQYNPNSIKLDTQAGKQIMNSGNGLDQANGLITELFQSGVTTMSFQLVFDDMNPSDAFMINSRTLLTGSTISKIANKIKKRKGGEYSVKDQIDGLMSLLVSRVTRQVVFFWSNMCFRGEVTNVSANYTMFNPQGNPIRGIVHLSIRQGSNGDGTGYDYSYEEKYWRNAFEQAFDENGMSGVKSKAQKIMQNNFLNVNI